MAEFLYYALSFPTFIFGMLLLSMLRTRAAKKHQEGARAPM